jgi:hypothetical protein
MSLSGRYVTHHHRSGANGCSRSDRDARNHRRTSPDVRSLTDSHPAGNVYSWPEGDVIFHLRIVSDGAIKIDLHMVPDPNIGRQDRSGANHCSLPDRDVALVETNSRIDQCRVTRKPRGRCFLCHCLSNCSAAGGAYGGSVRESLVCFCRCQHGNAVYLMTDLIASTYKAGHAGGRVPIFFGDQPRYFAGKTTRSENHDFCEVTRHDASSSTMSNDCHRSSIQPTFSGENRSRNPSPTCI